MESPLEGVSLPTSRPRFSLMLVSVRFEDACLTGCVPNQCTRPVSFMPSRPLQSHLFGI